MRKRRKFINWHRDSACPFSSLERKAVAWFTLVKKRSKFALSFGSDIIGGTGYSASGPPVFTICVIYEFHFCCDRLVHFENCFLSSVCHYYLNVVRFTAFFASGRTERSPRSRPVQLRRRLLSRPGVAQNRCFCCKRPQQAPSGQHCFGNDHDRTSSARFAFAGRRVGQCFVDEQQQRDLAEDWFGNVVKVIRW